jgi:glycosyltransferase involved in cell wall biosynthesis
MRILMVAPQPFFRPRGTPLSVLHRIRALARLGHTVELVTYPFGDSPGIEGLTIHRTGPLPLVRDVPVGPSIAKLILDGPLFRRAGRLAATGRFDLLHTHEEAGWLGARFRKKYGLPHLYDMHSSLPQQVANFKPFDRRLVIRAFERLERHTLAHADGVIAICDALRDHALALGYRGPLAMIENTLDFDVAPPGLEDARALRSQLGLEEGPIIMYTGTLEPYQGLELLMAAVPAVLRRVPDARLVVVGGTEAQIAELARRAADQGVTHTVRFVPAVPPTEVSRYQQLADVLVTTRSRGTNTPLKLYQYMRAGRPIVATNIASHTQVLDPTTAELVAPQPEAIADGLVRVLLDPSHGRALARSAERLAAERYGEATYMARLEGLLAQLPVPGRRLQAVTA